MAQWETVFEEYSSHGRYKEDKIINWKSVKEILHEGMGMKEWKNETGLNRFWLLLAKKLKERSKFKMTDCWATHLKGNKAQV